MVKGLSWLSSSHDLIRSYPRWTVDVPNFHALRPNFRCKLESAGINRKHSYPLVICYIAMEYGPVEIVDLPIDSMVIFHSYVTLPEGISNIVWIFLNQNPVKFPPENSAMKVEARPSAGHAVLPAVPRAFPEDESYGSGTSPDLRRRTGKKSLGFFFLK